MLESDAALIDRLYRTKGKAGIVDGKIKRFGPVGGLPGWIKGSIMFALARFEEEHGGGVALGGLTAYLVDLPRRKSFCPDGAWISGSPADLTPKFIEGAPLFALEVRSEGDYGPAAEKRILRKIAEYFEAGTLVVWDVDPLSDDLIKCYRASSPESPQVFRNGDLADAEPAVPGWRFPVAKLIRS